MKLGKHIQRDYDMGVTITVPDELFEAGQLTPAEVRFELAPGLYVDRKTTLGKAAELAGMSPSDFIDQLGRRRIPIHYEMADLESDLETIRILREKRAADQP